MDMLNEFFGESPELHVAADLLKVGEENRSLGLCQQFKFLAILLEENSLQCLRIRRFKDSGEVIVLV